MARFRGTKHRRGFDIWQIIYIDLMTNVMIFFVVLWAIQNKQNKGGISDTFGTETVKMVNLPGDVLFASGRSDLSEEGRHVIKKLFEDGTQTVLNFDTGALTRRMLLVHGHTDSDGTKAENFDLGYHRALAAYLEISKYGGEVHDHIVICTHADNTPAQEVPAFGGQLSVAEQSAVKEAKSKNRRITIEDKVLTRPKESRR